MSYCLAVVIWTAGNHCSFLLVVSQRGCSLYLNSVQHAMLYFHVGGWCITHVYFANIIFLLTRMTPATPKLTRHIYASKQNREREASTCILLNFQKIVYTLFSSVWTYSSVFTSCSLGKGKQAPAFYSTSKRSFTHYFQQCLNLFISFYFTQFFPASMTE